MLQSIHRHASKLLFVLLALFLQDDLSAAHRIISGRSANLRNRARIANRGNHYRNWWSARNAYPFGWPSYYAYYGYPIAGSIYYYSFPTNSSFYYSYPSYSRNWTYPSYPYVGKYYVNDAPFTPRRLVRPPRYTSYVKLPAVRDISVQGPRTGVFISE